MKLGPDAQAIVFCTQYLNFNPCFILQVLTSQLVPVNHATTAHLVNVHPDRMTTIAPSVTTVHSTRPSLFRVQMGRI